MTKMIKCRFCEWKTLAWRRSKKGKVKSGYLRLLSHVFYEHRREYDCVQECLEGLEEKN